MDLSPRRAALTISALAIVTSATSCTPQVTPGLGVVGSPLPADGEKATSLSATFDLPMVAPSAVGQVVAKPPFSIEPARDGEFRWSTDRELVFTPAAPLPRSTRFEMELPKGTRALDGHGLVQPFRWSFETKRIEAELSFPPGSIADPSHWAVPDQPVKLQLTQPALPKAVEKACAFVSDARRVAVALTEKDDAPRVSYRFTPEAPLALDTGWTVECRETLVGTEGPLGLEKAAELAFRTYGPMKLVGITPQTGDVDIDKAEISVEFSNPVRRGPRPIGIQPAIEGFPERMYPDGGRLAITAQSLSPETKYTIEVDGAVTDVFGQRLDAAHRAAFTTGAATPRFDLQTGSFAVETARGSYPLWVRNLTKIEVQGAAVAIDRLPALLGELDWWDEKAVDLAKLKLRAVKKTVALKPKGSRWEQVALEPNKLLGPSTPRSGFYYFSVRAPEAPNPDERREVLLNLTDLGLTTKLSAHSGLAWVTRLSDGKPVEGAEIVILDRKGKTRWKGQTDAQGIAVTPGRGAFAEKKETRSEGEEGEGEILEEERHSSESSRLLVLAKSGDDVTFVDPERSGGLSSWNFHVPSEPSSDPEKVRGFLHSDRGLYRPGDKVYLKGLARTMRLGERLRVPAGRAIDLVVSNPRGVEIAHKKLELSRYGGFDFQLDLPEDARLGDYAVRAELAGEHIDTRFAVEEYRPATFEVNARSKEKECFVGKRCVAESEARYLYGAPMREGKIKWTAHRQRRSVSFEKFPRFTFDDHDPDGWGWESPDEGQELLTEEERTLDESGKSAFALTVSDKIAEPTKLLLSASAEDETHQTVAANLEIPVHATSAYLGIQSDFYVTKVGEPRRLQVVAVDTRGERIPLASKAKIARESYSCAWESWGYSGSYRCEEKTAPVAALDLEIPKEGPAEIPFAPREAGTYLVSVEGKDAAGRKIAVSRRVYAAGAEDAGFRAEESERFTIIADKAKYKVGDTAHLLLRTSVKDTLALVTEERDGVLDHRLMPFASGTPTLDVPIRDPHLPNVYVSVVLVNGRSGAGARGLPSLKMGLADLKVETEEKDLQVAVATDRPSYRPGEQVTATVLVTDHRGAPVKGEISLAAADEGVLTLIGYKTPDPLATFYAPWPLGVTTATQYERLARLPDPGQERPATGGDGDGGGGGGRPRSQFRATAFWAPKLETDDQGKASVTFAAPDNLTAYRLMAVVADAGDRFGSAEKRFTVRKPLQLLSALPRFLNVGDEVQAGVLVINDGDGAGKVTVEADVQGGVELAGDRKKTIELAKGARAPVYVKAKATASGDAKFRFSAALGAERDVVELVVPVRHPAPVETLVLAQGETKSAVEVPLKLPSGILPNTATLEISVDPDGIAGIEEGLRGLVQYPYGCLEQTTSRLIPLVMVEELARSLDLPGLDGPNLQRFIRAGVAKIGLHQSSEGGFSLWPGGEPESYLTAYGLFGLKIAADAGHPVDAQRVNEAVAYLRKSLAEPPEHGVHDELGELGGRAFALYVLDRLGSPEPGFATQLLESRDKLPRFGLAFLARALSGSLGPRDAAVTSLLDDLVKLAKPDPRGGAFIEEPGDLRWYMSDDTRTTAIVADALIALRPADPAIPELVRGLMSARTSSRHGYGWGSTQDNLYTLLALTDYAKSRTHEAGSVDVTLAGQSVLRADLASRSPSVHRRTVPLSVDLEKGPLVVKAEGSPAHYTALLRFRRDLEHQTASSDGLTLGREYLDADTGRPVTAVKTGDLVRVRVTIETAKVREHVAISDLLPAGFEPVSSKFATTARREKTARSWQIDYQEQRDDRVDTFNETLWSGRHSFVYLVRATSAGKFIVPGATSEEMYAPAVHARLAPQRLEVKSR